MLSNILENWANIHCVEKKNQFGHSVVNYCHSVLCCSKVVKPFLTNKQNP